MLSMFGKMAKCKPVKACIFDMDGLILDTETLYTKVTQNILDECGTGKVYTWDVKQSVMGLQREDVATRLVKYYELPMTVEEYMDRTQEYIETYMRNCKLMPDTEKIYEKVFSDVCKRYNKPFPLETRLKVLGTTEARSCAITVTDCQLPITVSEFQKQYRELSLGRLRDVSVLRGAERLIRHLHDTKVPICLATSSGEESVAVKITHHQELFKLFLHKVMGSSDPDVKEGKPAPDIFLVAASRFLPHPIKPEECLVFEDAPNGVKAAVSAGMQVVMVPDDNVTAEQRQNATLVLKTLEDFKPEDFGLPPFPQ